MGKDKKIGVAMDFSKSSKNALKWAIDNLGDKGDTFYIIHINSNPLDQSLNKLWAKSGARKFYFPFLFLSSCMIRNCNIAIVFPSPNAVTIYGNLALNRTFL